MNTIMVGRGLREFDAAMSMDVNYRREFAFDCDWTGHAGEAQNSLDRPEMMAAGSTINSDHYGPIPSCVKVG